MDSAWIFLQTLKPCRVKNTGKYCVAWQRLGFWQCVLELPMDFTRVFGGTRVDPIDPSEVPNTDSSVLTGGGRHAAGTIVGAIRYGDIPKPHYIPLGKVRPEKLAVALKTPS